jgi:glycerol-3-phosphate acyltransferase PlsY
MPPPGEWSTVVGLSLIGFAIGYFLGSIPFGLILIKLSGGGDIRDIGSGNIGATNVLRTGNKPLAALTLALDVLKGTVAVWLGAQLDPYAAMFAGLGAFLGHLFPVWLGFRGGKGVATYIGVALGLSWPTALGFCVVWLLVAVTTRYSSLSALVASAATMAALSVTKQWQVAALFTVLTVLLYIRHAANIGRLIKGEEARIGESKQGA